MEFEFILIEKKDCSAAILLSDSGRIQTCNLLIRSQMLYSVEPRSHFVSAKVHFFINLQAFDVLFFQNSISL